MKAQFCMAI